MLRRVLAGATVFALLLVGLPAVAAGQQGPQARETYSFDGDTIKTRTLTPDGAEITAGPTKGSAAFLTIRTSFVQEVVRSAADL